MKHEDVWRALDTLAAEHGLSPSGLARKSGLNATTFNPSKRRMVDGRARWPTTESVAKVLQATGASLEAFTALVSGARALQHSASTRRGATQQRVPLIGFAKSCAPDLFDDRGFPTGTGWHESTFPEIDDNSYALEIEDNSTEPVFRAGDLILISPNAPVRRGDRVFVRTRAGQGIARELIRRSARRIELRSLSPRNPDIKLNLAEVAWMHRVVWASQ